jgi:hypothetical protein
MTMKMMFKMQFVEHPMLLFHQNKASILFPSSSNQQQAETESKLNPEEKISSK